MSYIKVCSCLNEIEAGVAISILKENRFNPFEFVKTPHISLAGVDQCFYIEVPETEGEQARQFLKEFGIAGVMSS